MSGQPEDDAPAGAGEAGAPATAAEVERPEPPDPADWEQALRLAEALAFASDRPVTPQRLQPVLPARCEARAVLQALAERRAEAPVRLVEVAGGYAFRTAPGLAPALTRVVEVPRRLPRVAMETLAIIAYHQPATRAEVEEIRGAALSQATVESLLEMGLIQPRGRKEVPGRPTLWGTTPKFLEQFGLRSLADLPRREELVNEPTLPLPASAPPG
jgi:segregation and condensation protein B